MIESKILGSAVGIQRQDVIDNTETNVLPSLANGVIAGHFKRGRMDKTFKVTADNYRALLGNDPSNPSYMAIEDAFKLGVSELSVLRIGSSSSDFGSIGVGGGIDAPLPVVNPSVCTPTYNETLFNVRNGDENPIGLVHAKYRINGGPWENYMSISDDYSVVDIFFESLYYDDWQMIHVGGGNGEAAFATGYHQANIYGASASSKYMKDQDGIRAYKAYTIDFEVTQNNRNDLVYLAFGKDTTIKSCAIGTWMGY